MTRPIEKIVEAVQNAERITWHEFCLAANRTASGGLFPSGYPADLAAGIMQEFVQLGQHLDQLKKALFYGKGMPQVVEDDSYNFDPIDLPSTTEWPDHIPENIVHWILGEATESIELVEALLKSLKSDNPLDIINLMEEEGDGHWYRALPYIEALNNEGVDPDDRIQLVWRKVLLKLIKRYGEKFSADSAIHRDTNLERKVLKEGIVGEDGQIHSAIEQQIILTSEPDLETARQALAALAKAEQDLQAAHTDILTEAEQYINMLLLQKVLPSEIEKMDMPVLIKNQVRQMIASPTPN